MPTLRHEALEPPKAPVLRRIDEMRASARGRHQDRLGDLRGLEVGLVDQLACGIEHPCGAAAVVDDAGTEERRHHHHRAYSVGPVLLHQRLAQRDHRGLRGVVGRHLRTCAETGDARDVDDQAARSARHVADHRPAGVRHAAHVDVEAPIPVLRRGLVEASGHRDTGAVDRDIDPACDLDRCIHHGLHGGRVTDIAR